jgi:hypothetical protein
MNTFVKLLILMNILNVIDAIQTYICVNYFVCVDLNPFVYYWWFYVVKILSGVVISAFYYYAYTRFDNFNKKLTYFSVVFVNAVYVLIVLSNMLHFIRVFC